MLIKVKFTPEMIDILKGLVGQTLLRVEYSGPSTFQGAKYVYEYVRLYFSNITVELTNTLQYYPDFDDEIARFACKQITGEYPYYPETVVKAESTVINKCITGIELIHDTVDLDHGETILEFHAALIFNTDAGDLIFFRHAWWADDIGIAVNKDYDKLYPISQEIDLWENEDEHVVSVTRRRERIA